MIAPLSPLELACLQFELALAIGPALDTGIMLAHALPAFMDKLGCVAGAVYLRREDGWSPAIAQPSRIEENEVIQVIESRIADLHELRSVKIEQVATNQWVYLFPLGDVGTLGLMRLDEPMHECLLQAMPPLMDKLAEACRAGIQNEEITGRYQNISVEYSMLRALVDYLPLIVFVLDEQGRFVLSEGRGLSLLGRAPGQVVGRLIFDVYAGVPAILANVRAALGGYSRSFTVEINGRSYDARYEPLLDQAKSVKGMVGVALDVTDTQSAINKLAAVLETVGEGIIVIDSRGRITLINRAVEEIFGYNQHELIGESMNKILPEKYHRDHEFGVDQFMRAGDPLMLNTMVEFEGRHRNGRIFPMEIYIAETRAGEEKLFTAAVRDITERKAYDRMRDDFVSSVSHELRTPLASIMGWTETLLGGRPGPITPQQKRFLEIVRDNGSRLNQLVEEILTVAQVQRGKLQLNLARFEPARMLSGVIEMLQPIAQKRGVTLSMQDAWSGGLVSADIRRIEQVLINLISNAIKFSHENSEVIMRSSSAGNCWRVEVEDHGIGISSEDIPNLFQRFYRAGTATQAQVQGTGIGLYVCKGIIEAHAGRIDLSSARGQGTMVWFEIPATQ